MEERAESFLNAFADIERVLRRVVRATPSTAFSAVLRDAAKQAAAVRQYEDDLREYAELRRNLFGEAERIAARAVSASACRQ